MDHSERLAQEYLQSLCIGPVVYEPDGNIPPDFSVGDHIAVEVRRLNQNYEMAGGGYQGLEQLWVPLWQRLGQHLSTLGESEAGECWYVCIDFRRPLEDWRTLRPLPDQALTEFKARLVRKQTTIEITPNFSVDLVKSGVDHGCYYLLGAGSDNDSGGLVMGEVERNLRLCIAEKERKIAPYRGKYQQWWLVLSDHVAYGMDCDDLEAFRKEVMPRVPHSFDKIVLVDPSDYRRAVEV